MTKEKYEPEQVLLTYQLHGEQSYPEKLILLHLVTKTAAIYGIQSCTTVLSSTGILDFAHRPEF
jgi:hypothetical protein